MDRFLHIKMVDRWIDFCIYYIFYYLNIYIFNGEHIFTYIDASVIFIV